MLKHALENRVFSIALGSILALCVIVPGPAAAQEPILGQLMVVGFNFCPRGWAEADGQLLPISSNSALFSLFGTFYGGDGRTTFALPDLRGRAPIHEGSAPGLATYNQGQRGGAESLSIGIVHMPAHNHLVNATNSAANKGGPGTDFLAGSQIPPPGADPLIYHDGPPNKIMDPAMIANTGGGQEIDKRSPYLVMKWCVALSGIYPSRD